MMQAITLTKIENNKGSQMGHTKEYFNLKNTYLIWIWHGAIDSTEKLWC
jgi:hypothetical protein